MERIVKARIVPMEQQVPETMKYFFQINSVCSCNIQKTLFETVDSQDQEQYRFKLSSMVPSYVSHYNPSKALCQSEANRKRPKQHAWGILPLMPKSVSSMPTFVLYCHRGSWRACRHLWLGSFSTKTGKLGIGVFCFSHPKETGIWSPRCFRREH